MGLACASDTHETDLLSSLLETALAQSLPGKEEGRALRFTDAEEHLAWQPGSSDLRQQSTRGIEKSKRLL